MTTRTLRTTTPQDAPALTALYERAFADEDLMPLVSALLSGDHDVLSLVADRGGTVAGHVLFTRCDTRERGRAGALLAPLAVHPDHQGKGLGTDLVQAALVRLARNGARQVFVLGDPGYYARFGFAPERRVMPPYPLPGPWADAWQSVMPGDAPALDPGPLVLPQPWMDPALWTA